MLFSEILDYIREYSYNTIVFVGAQHTPIYRGIYGGPKWSQTAPELPDPDGLSDVRDASSEPGNLDHRYPTRVLSAPE